MISALSVAGRAATVLQYYLWLVICMQKDSDFKVIGRVATDREYFCRQIAAAVAYGDLANGKCSHSRDSL